jgi:adenylate cyclase
MAGDIAGYSRLMGIDDEGTLRQLKAHRKELVDPKIAEHRGRIVKTTGDGILVEFVSVVDAVRCAVEIARGMSERNANVPTDRRIEFRTGINVGDIISDGNDIFGDGVNVAARLEGLAEPGGVCVSLRVQEDTSGKLDFAFEDVGEQRFKNIARPVRAYRVRLSGGLTSALPTLALPEKPSIAVMPFQNMSGDPEQEYFADGVVEDIITALSRVKSFFVIARNSTFTYKGRAVDVRQVGRELGVRYVLEGSIRKAGNRVRITGQLIEASTGAHLWADRFEGGLDDIFALQDEVTGNVLGAIAPTLEQAEIERAKRKPTESLDAYDYFLRATASLHEWTREGSDDALRLFFKAIDLDPAFASAYGLAAWCYVWRKVNGWMVDREQEVAEATRLGRRAVDLGGDDAVALAGGGYALAFVAHDLDRGAAFIEQALALNPNLAGAWYASGWVKAFSGEPDEAIKHLTHAIRLSPRDPLGFRALGGIAFANLLAGRYDEACSWAERSLQQRPNYLAAARDLAAASALAGQLVRAQEAMARLRQLNPALRLADVKHWVPIRRPEHLAKLQEGLRIAGLPE